MGGNKDILHKSDSWQPAYRLADLNEGFLTHFASEPKKLLAHPSDIRDGKMMGSSEPDFQTRMIPNDQVRNAILFANQGSFEGLRRAVRDDIKQLCRHFTVPGYMHHADRPSIELTLDEDAIFRALDITEEAMEGINRRTGEPGIAHQYRIVIRGAAKIRENLRLQNAGKYIMRYTQPTATVGLLTRIFHDYEEDQIEQGEGLPERSLGKVNLQNDGIAVELYGDGWTRDKPVVKKSTFISLNRHYAAYLIDGLEVLNTLYKVKGREVEEMVEQIDRQEKENPTQLSWTQMFRKDAYLTKLDDRMDNVYTTTWVFDKQTGKNIASQWNKIRDKAVEVIDGYGIFEDAMFEVFSDIGGPVFSVDNFYKTILSMRITDRNKDSGKGYSLPGLIFQPGNEAKMHSQYQKWRPTRCALLMLHGLGPNLIFGKNPFQVGGLWLPESI